MRSDVKRLILVAGVVLAAARCGGDDDSGQENGGSDGGGSGGGGPIAPSDLMVEPLGGGGHITWMDNSDDETEFMIMRKTGSAEYRTLATVPFDTEQYHDAPVTSGTTYTYKVIAMNDDGESESEEVEFTAP